MLKGLREREESLVLLVKWGGQDLLGFKDHLDPLVKEVREESLDHQVQWVLQVLVVEKVTRDLLVTLDQWECLALQDLKDQLERLVLLVRQETEVSEV